MTYRKLYRARTLRIAVLILSVVLTGLLAGFSPRGSESSLTEIKTFEGGTAYRTSDDAYWVLSLNGTWREMGRQYGGLVGDDLRQFYADISADVATRGMDYDKQLENAKAIADGLSSNLNELLKGMAEASDLSEDEVLVLNAGMANLAIKAMGIEIPSSCSGLAAWDRYTPNGTLVFGRNWDMDRESMGKYMKYLSVVVFNPDSGNSFANVHPLGSVFLETGMNDKGLFVELNNGGSSDPHYVEGREDSASVLATLLNEYSSLDEASKYLSEVPADYSYIIQLADTKEAVSVERPTFGTRVRRSDQNGVLAAYNSFIPPYPKEWEGKVADPPKEEDDPRYSNLITLANSKEFFGNLDADGMKRLMGIWIRDGGAMHEGSVYQVVAVPQEFRLWIRGLDYSDWQQVDLKDLFTNK
ncbi:MAG TPA: C45 family peptidase [Chloroflexota bacterium]|nr:C45 family peptidase [Chloroflexota bacterium]